MHSRSSLVLAAILTCASAQYVNNNTIGSCADVDCPAPGNGGTTVAECRVTNRTYGLIGLKSFPTEITENQENLTWTIGTQVYDNVDGNRTRRNIQKDFYLGTPPSLDLGSEDLPYEGCAIFLYDNAMNRPAHNESSECADVIGAKCMASLLADASALLSRSRNDTESAQDACRRVRDGLSQTFADGCETVAGQGSWNGVEAVALTGDSAPHPPDSSRDESSTCHPTLPKSNDLTYVFGYNDTGTVDSGSTISMFYSVNLVLTMFWSPDREAEAALELPDSQLTCLWPIDLNNAQLETMTPNEGVLLSKPSALASLVAVGLVLYQLV